MARANTTVRDGTGRHEAAVFARDGSILTIAQRGRWACLTIVRDDGGPRALDILLDPDDSGQLVRWLTEYQDAR